MNWVIGKAGRKPKIQAMLTDMLASKESQAQILILDQSSFLMALLTLRPEHKFDVKTPLN